LPHQSPGRECSRRVRDLCDPAKLLQRDDGVLMRSEDLLQLLGGLDEPARRAAA
jgi:hypothetical protein